MRHRVPTACFEPNPDSSTVRLGGRSISLVVLAKVSKYERSHICRVLAGTTAPSVDCALALSKALGLGENGEGSVDDLMRLIQARIGEIGERKIRRSA